MKCFKAALIYLWVLNLVDTVCTLYWISEGIASEANPLLDYVLREWGPPGFLSVKLVTVTIAVVYLWRMIPERGPVVSKIGVWSAYIVCAIYTYIALLHLAIAVGASIV